MTTLNLRSPTIAVPVTTALFGFMALGGGAWTFLSPGADAARLFGIVLPRSIAGASTIPAAEEAENRQRAYIRIHGIRNFASGAGLLGLTAFWTLSSLCRDSPAASEAVKKSFGILLATGSLVGLADGYILSEYKESKGLSSEGQEVATKQSQGHFLTALPIMALAASWWFVDF